MKRVATKWQPLTEDEEGDAMTVKVDYHKAEVVVRDGRTMITKQCHSWRAEAQLWKGEVKVATMYQGMGTQCNHPETHPWVIFGQRLSVVLACVAVLEEGTFNIVDDIIFTGDVSLTMMESAKSAAQNMAKKKRQRTRRSQQDWTW